MSVAHVLGIRVCAVAVLFTVASASAACAAVACPPSARPSDTQVLVKVVHVEGSDGPTTWTLVAYADGVLELVRLGKRRLCREIPRRELQALIDLVEGEPFQNVAEFDGFLGHQEWMQVIHRDTIRRFVAEDLPPEVLAVFEELDRLFSKEFGRRYSWPLIGSASGPGRRSASR
jgi:hypothetical protein